MEYNYTHGFPPGRYIVVTEQSRVEKNLRYIIYLSGLLGIENYYSSVSEQSQLTTNHCVSTKKSCIVFPLLGLIWLLFFGSIRVACFDGFGFSFRRPTIIDALVLGS